MSRCGSSSSAARATAEVMVEVESKHAAMSRCCSSLHSTNGAWCYAARRWACGRPHRRYAGGTTGSLRLTTIGALMRSSSAVHVAMVLDGWSDSAVDAGDAEELERAWLAALATGCPEISSPPGTKLG